MAAMTEHTPRRFDHEATEILQRFDGDERLEHARRWLDRWAATFAGNFALDGVVGDTRHVDNVAKLILLVAQHDEVLGGFAEAFAKAADMKRNPVRDALLPLAALWSARERAIEFPQVLSAWAKARLEHCGRPGRWPPGMAAFALRDRGELAFALLDARSDESESHERALWTSWIVLLRLRENVQDFSPRELARVSADVLVMDSRVRALAREIYETGRTPAQLVDIVEAELQSEDPPRRYGALAILLASHRKTDRTRAVEMLAKWMLKELSFPLPIELHGACSKGQHGWSREDVGRQLLPVTRVLWRRPLHDVQLAKQSWPLGALLPVVQGRDDYEDGWERLRDCVAERLLEIARDPGRPHEERIAALSAIVPLRPGRHAGFFRALGPLCDDSLVGVHAKEARRRLRRAEKAEGKCDAELAIEDAWIAYWSAVS